jgi:hypothetical protein
MRRDNFNKPLRERRFQRNSRPGVGSPGATTMICRPLAHAHNEDVDNICQLFKFRNNFSPLVAHIWPHSDLLAAQK